MIEIRDKRGIGVVGASRQMNVTLKLLGLEQYRWRPSGMEARRRSGRPAASAGLAWLQREARRHVNMLLILNCFIAPRLAHDEVAVSLRGWVEPIVTLAG